MTGLVLHNYWRSSTSYRVRIALAMKGLDYEYVPHHLRYGEHLEPAYKAVNPQGLVPALILEDGRLLSQSLAIIEYLDETVPEPPLLPDTAVGRARVRMLAQIIACDIHPVNNQPLETMLSSSSETGTFCHGDMPGLADICLAAQVLNNTRFGVDMSPYPTISRIHEACMALPAFQQAAHARQPDLQT